MIDCELSRFVLAHYRIPYREEPHIFAWVSVLAVMHGDMAAFPSCMDVVSASRARAPSSTATTPTARWTSGSSLPASHGARRSKPTGISTTASSQPTPPPSPTIICCPIATSCWSPSPAAFRPGKPRSRRRYIRSCGRCSRCSCVSAPARPPMRWPGCAWSSTRPMPVSPMDVLIWWVMASPWATSRSPPPWLPLFFPTATRPLSRPSTPCRPSCRRSSRSCASAPQRISSAAYTACARSAFSGFALSGCRVPKPSRFSWVNLRSSLPGLTRQSRLDWHCAH